MKIFLASRLLVRCLTKQKKNPLELNSIPCQTGKTDKALSALYRCELPVSPPASVMRGFSSHSSNLLKLTTSSTVYQTSSSTSQSSCVSTSTFYSSTHDCWTHEPFKLVENVANYHPELGPNCPFAIWRLTDGISSISFRAVISVLFKKQTGPPVCSQGVVVKLAEDRSQCILVFRTLSPDWSDGQEQ